MSSDSTSLVIILVCLVLSAYFSATETAFSTMSHARMKTMADKGDKSAALALQLADNYDTLLSAILIGNNLVNILLSSVATLLFVKFLGEQTGASVATASVTVVVLIFGEISPKSIAKESPEKFAMFSAPFIRALMVLLKPFIWMFAQWKKLLVKLFNKPSDERGITDEELMTIVEEAEQEGGIDADESTLIRSAIGFMDLETSDIYTPRVDIESIPLDATKEEIAKMFLDTGFSRLPVYEEDIDHIIGIINQKDFHNFIYHTDRPLKDIIRPVLFITPTMKIGVLLKKLQDSKTHIAIILDEFGGTEGLVTIEDIIEELVGDIWDEHDEVEAGIKKLDDGSFIVPEDMDLDDFFEQFSINTETEASTINGWITEQIGKIPEVGDSFDFENPVSEEEDSEKDKENQNNKPQKLHIEVTQTEGQKAEEIHVVLLHNDESEESKEKA